MKFYISIAKITGVPAMGVCSAFLSITSVLLRIP